MCFLSPLVGVEFCEERDSCVAPVFLALGLGMGTQQVFILRMNAGTNKWVCRECPSVLVLWLYSQRPHSCAETLPFLGLCFLSPAKVLHLNQSHCIGYHFAQLSTWQKTHRPLCFLLTESQKSEKTWDRVSRLFLGNSSFPLPGDNWKDTSWQLLDNSIVSANSFLMRGHRAPLLERPTLSTGTPVSPNQCRKRGISSSNIHKTALVTRAILSLWFSFSFHI